MCGVGRSEGQWWPEPNHGEPWKVGQVLEVVEAEHEMQKMN